MTLSNNFTKSQLAKQYNTHERGAALIVVLLFLILIMLAGAMAVRQSNNDLKTATADQINSLLLQSADSANERLESIVNRSDVKDTTYTQLMDQTGVLGYFLPPNGVNHKNNEIVYCYKPRDDIYQVDNATLYVNKGGGTQSNNGICNYKQPEDYTTDRQTVLTQVSVTKKPIADDSDASIVSDVSATSSTTLTKKTSEAVPFGDMALGRDSVGGADKSPVLDIRSISAIPSYNEPSTTTNPSGSCFGEAPTASATAATNVLACLRQRNTPSKMLYTQATLENKTKKTECVHMGTAGSSDVVDGVLVNTDCR